MPGDSEEDYNVLCIVASWSSRQTKIFDSYEHLPSEQHWHPKGISAEPGDQLWRFRSPQETWDKQCGIEGFSLLKDGLVAGYTITDASIKTGMIYAG